VRESGIPGAGLGAFLTYLGARVLREDVQNVENVSRELLVVNNGGLTMPLMATSRDGFGISVTLNGAMLVGKRCSSILGDHAHFDGRCPKLIGGHGVYNESDFVLVPEIELFRKTVSSILDDMDRRRKQVSFVCVKRIFAIDQQQLNRFIIFLKIACRSMSLT
jgi:hypothetical protein